MSATTAFYSAPGTGRDICRVCQELIEENDPNAMFHRVLHKVEDWAHKNCLETWWKERKCCPGCMEDVTHVEGVGKLEHLQAGMLDAIKEGRPEALVKASGTGRLSGTALERVRRAAMNTHYFQHFDSLVNYWNGGTHQASSFCLMAELGETKLVQAMLSRSLSPVDFQKAAHAAASLGHSEVVELLTDEEKISKDISRGMAHLLLGKKSPEKAFYFAARKNYLDVIDRMLDTSLISTDLGQELLVWASAHGHTEVVQKLLGRKDIVKTAYEGAAAGKALVAAAKNQHVGVIQQLTHLPIANADIECAAKHAAEEGHLDVLRTLPLEACSFVEDVLRIATDEGHLEIVQEYLPQMPQKELILGELLLTAIQNGHTQIAQKLFDEKAWIQKDSRSELLFETVEKDRAKMLEELIRRWSISEDDRETAIGTASTMGHLASLRVLLNSSLSPERYTSLIIQNASEKGHAHIVNELMPKTTISDRETCMKNAAAYGHAKVLRSVLTDENRGMALRIAAHHGHRPLIWECLFRQRAEHPRIRLDYIIALRNAARQGHLAIVQWLLRLEDDKEPKVRNDDSPARLRQAMLLDSNRYGDVWGLIHTVTDPYIEGKVLATLNNGFVIKEGQIADYPLIPVVRELVDDGVLELIANIAAHNRHAPVAAELRSHKQSPWPFLSMQKDIEKALTTAGY